MESPPRNLDCFEGVSFVDGFRVYWSLGFVNCIYRLIKFYMGVGFIAWAQYPQGLPKKGHRGKRFGVWSI